MLFLHPHALRVCHSPKLRVFSHCPYADCAGITGVCVLQVFPIPSGTELSLIKIMLFTETDGGGTGRLSFV